MMKSNDDLHVLCVAMYINVNVNININHRHKPKLKPKYIHNFERIQWLCSYEFYMPMWGRTTMFHLFDKVPMQWFILIIKLIKYGSSIVWLCLFYPAFCAAYGILFCQRFFSSCIADTHTHTRAHIVVYINIFAWIKCDVACTLKFTSSGILFMFSETANTLTHTHTQHIHKYVQH